MAIGFTQREGIQFWICGTTIGSFNQNRCHEDGRFEEREREKESCRNSNFTVGQTWNAISEVSVMLKSIFKGSFPDYSTFLTGMKISQLFEMTGR
jgi:hypothetical protein